MNISELIKDSDTPVVLVDGTDESLDLLAMVREVRENCPCIVFADFWDPARATAIFKVIDDMGIQAFSFSPIKVDSDGYTVWATYQTDKCRITTVDPYRDEFFSKVIGFDGDRALIPTFLWNKVFATEPIEVFDDLQVIYAPDSSQSRRS